MATNLYAMEALSTLVWHLADQKTYDIRIEAAIAKIFCSEHTIRFLRDAQILFGGMGYETADSKRVRGEPAFIIEQLVRDAEMYRIGEGATDILRPFVAREGLNPHLERARAYVEGNVTGRSRHRELVKLLRYYLPWYLEQWQPTSLPHRPEFASPHVRKKLRYVEQASRRFARAILHSMARYRDALRDDQGRQNRLEAIGADLLTIAATALHADMKGGTKDDQAAWTLADDYFRQAQGRIDRHLRELIRNDDHAALALGRRALRDEYDFLSRGAIRRTLTDYLPKNHTDLDREPCTNSQDAWITRRPPSAG
jgi:hypothetical protein